MHSAAPLGQPANPVMSLVEIVVASLGMVLFALFAHTRGAILLLAVVGLIATAAALAHGIVGSASVPRSFAIARPNGKSIAFLPAALGAWLVVAVMYRSRLGLCPLPQQLRRFALLGVLIGATEEMLYRGFIQTRLRSHGRLVAIMGAALAHTAYKTSLFLASSSEVDVLLLGIYTFLGGLILGALRDLAGDVMPAVAAHAAFDLVVYGDHRTAPWWVW